MNEEMKVAEGAASTAQSATAAAGGIESGLDPMRALAALANDLRWGLVWRMASGEELIAVDVAHELGRDPDGVSKHLRVLSDAGVAEARAELMGRAYPQAGVRRGPVRLASTLHRGFERATPVRPLPLTPPVGEPSVRPQQ